MGTRTTIEWTEMTWNPVTGCTKVSPGCLNCYAERMAKRLQAIGIKQYRHGFKPTLAPDSLEAPLSWRRPRVVFVNSMSDLFHKAVPLEYIRDVFSVIAATPQHTYQILTKRHMRLAELAPRLTWPTNLWMGVSVENQKMTRRIDRLIAVPAQIRFLSLEPLIGPILNLPLEGIHWVIVGGESGPRARPLDMSWVEAIRWQCEVVGVPFFFKQWGRRRFNVDQHDPTIEKTHPFHAKGGCQLNGAIYRQMPAISLAAI